MSGINPLVWRGLGALGGLLALIGALVAWATVAGYDESATGMDFAEGETVSLAGIAILIACCPEMTVDLTRRSRRACSLAFAILSLVAIGWRHLIGETQETAPWLDKAASYLGIASTSRGSPHWAWVDRAVSLAGIAILIAVVLKWVDLNGLVDESGGALSIGAGIYLSLVGSLILIASAVPSIVELVNAARGSTDEAKTSAAASTPEASQPGSAADEIDKLADLLERGVLTQEEFDAKKKELLGL